jgi:6-phosphogluconolactonase (cycloisomerase 2 family)
MHPSGKFLYTVARSSSSTGFTPYAIVRYLINQNDGRLSQNVIEARYLLESSTSFCSPSILGFNTSGTKMYGGDFCSYPHGSGAATYYERSVDLQTGALGPAQEIYSWNYYGGSGAENVQFTKDLMFDFGLTEFDGDWVSVYQVQPKVSTPLVYCTASMWAVCGNYGYPALAHPSGQYVFLYDTTNITDIGQVNLTTQQIAPVGSIPYYIQQFSPDGTVVYALNDASSVLEIEIYGFDISSGQVTQGGTISAPSNLDSWFAAERY